jgi:hypothetical protein
MTATVTPDTMTGPFTALHAVISKHGLKPHQAVEILATAGVPVPQDPAVEVGAPLHLYSAHSADAMTSCESREGKVTRFASKVTCDLCAEAQAGRILAAAEAAEIADAMAAVCES